MFLLWLSVGFFLGFLVCSLCAISQRGDIEETRQIMRETDRERAKLYESVGWK